MFILLRPIQVLIEGFRSSVGDIDSSPRDLLRVTASVLVVAYKSKTSCLRQGPDRDSGPQAINPSKY